MLSLSSAEMLGSFSAIVACNMNPSVSTMSFFEVKEQTYLFSTHYISRMHPLEDG